MLFLTLGFPWAQVENRCCQKWPGKLATEKRERDASMVDKDRSSVLEMLCDPLRL